MSFLIGRVGVHQTPQQTDALNVIPALFAQSGQPVEQVYVNPAQSFARGDRPVFIQNFRQQISAIEVEGRFEQLRIIGSQRARGPAFEDLGVDVDASRSV